MASHTIAEGDALGDMMRVITDDGRMEGVKTDDCLCVFGPFSAYLLCVSGQSKVYDMYV